MALVSINLTVRDDKGEESVVTLYTTDGYTLPQLIGAVVALAPLVKNLIGGGIVSASLSIDVDLSGIAGISDIDVNSDVEEGALFIFQTDLGHPKRNRLPTFLEEFLLPGTKQVDMSDLSVAAFNNAIIAGLVVGAATVTFVDSRLEDIDAVSDAYESFQSSRKR